MNLKEQLAKLKGEFLALKKGIEGGDKDAIERATELKKEIEEVQEKIKAAEEAKGLLSFLGNEGGEGREPAGERKSAPRTFGEAAAAALKHASLERGEHVTIGADVAEAKAAGDVQVVPTGDYGQTYVEVRPEIRPGLRRRLTISQLFSHETTDKDAITFFTEGAAEGEPAAVAENGKFPSVHFGEPEEHSVSVKKIGVMYKQSDELLEDDTRLRENIDNRVGYMMDVEEENQLLNGNGSGANLKGLFQYAEQMQRMTVYSFEELLDALDDAKQGILQNTPGGFEASAFAINPSDWTSLKKLKDANGQYRAVSPFSVGPYGATTPGESGLRVWEMDPVPTPAIEAGTIVVAAWAMGGTIWDKNGGRRVDITNSDADDFEHGRIAIRTSQREGFGVEYPLAFVIITLDLTSLEDVKVDAMGGTETIYEHTVSDLQSNLIVGSAGVRGTLKYVTDGALPDYWGAGNFMALRLSEPDEDATSVKVGLEPSYGSGFAELIDPETGQFVDDGEAALKVSNKDTQKLVIISTDGHRTNRQELSLLGLTCQSSQ